MFPAIGNVFHVTALSLTEKVEQEQNKPNMAEKMFHRADTWKARIDKFMNSKPKSVSILICRFVLWLLPALQMSMPSFFSPPGDHKLSPAGQAYWLSPSGDSAPPKAR